MNILLFLGSGVSLQTGLPTSAKITDRLLNEDWHKSTHINFYPGKHNHEFFDKIDISSNIQKFLKYIYDYSDIYLKPRGIEKVNYEDIFYIVKQIHSELFLESDNPAINFFIEHLKKKFEYPNNPMFIESTKILEFRVFCSRAIDFINCVVWDSLYTNKNPVGFEIILELVNTEKIKKINIVTLNHDLLIEKYFKENKLDLIDGFGTPNGDYCKFIPSLYNEDKIKSKLFKPHGSIDWYRLRLEEGDIYTKLVGTDFLRIYDDKGDFIGTPLSPYPNFLTGSGNKTSDYNFGIFRDIFLKLDQELFDSDIIIMSGYGWNDKGINGRLQEWIMSSDDRRIILLHEHPESIKKSRSFMWHRYDNLVKWGRLIPVKKWMSDTKLDDIIKYLK